MIGLSQSEAGEQRFQNRMLVTILLVELAIEADLSMKDATCQVDHHSQTFISQKPDIENNITYYYPIRSNITSYYLSRR